MSNKDGYCFVWNESISNRGASEIASCVYHFIKQKVEDSKREFIFFSDNCSAQNKNRFYVTMLWFCQQKFGITSTTHKYLEKGHTQNKNDLIHATIASASRNIKIYTTPQWATAIRAARRDHTYVVKEMSAQDFFYFKDLSLNIKIFEINSDGE